MKRKKRSDRTHLIYCITDLDTQQQYIGLTVLEGTVQKTLNGRLRRHFWRATVEKKNWGLSKVLRKTNGVTIDLLDKIRGKAEAHQLEVAYIDAIEPTLNTKKKA